MGFGFAAAYMCLLYVGAMVAPGVGLSGQVMVLVPWFVLDGAHAPAYGLLAWLLTRTLEYRSWPFRYALIVASAAALVFGLWTEVFQGCVEGRHPSTGDVVIDAFGIGLAAFMMTRQRWRGQIPYAYRAGTSIRT